MLSLYWPAFLAAFLITLLELSEVVILVMAFSADHTSVKPGAVGAVSGTAVVAAVAIGSVALLLALPRVVLLWASAVLLLGFGLFLGRSTLRSYRRGLPGFAPPPASSGSRRSVTQFAGGFSIGTVETIEAAIVLVALAAAGYGWSALLGAVAGGGVLIAATASVHDRVRRIKVPLLKLGATSLLFAFAIFWGGEAAGVDWPYADLVLLPLFFTGLVVSRIVVSWDMWRTLRRLETKG